MDGRDTMAISGPASYYMHHGLVGPGSGSQPGAHSLQGMRTLTNPSPSMPVQLATMGGRTIGAVFDVEPPSSLLQHGINGGSQGGAVAQEEPVRKKRGRPRKYGHEGTVSLALSPLSSSTPAPGSGVGDSGIVSAAGSGRTVSVDKRRRGRPPGTGKNQQLACYGEWISSSAGMGFTPHIITISSGEDITSKIMSFSQQGPRAICILSANGIVSAVTLRQPASSGGTVTYEGHFEILSLSGSYVLTDSGGSRSRTGGLSISLRSPDGRLVGGGLGGLLVAASPVQVLVGSFIYGGRKAKNKPKAGSSSGDEAELLFTDKQMTPSSSTPSNQDPNPVLSGWPVSRQSDVRNAHIDIDLTQG